MKGKIKSILGIGTIACTFFTAGMITACKEEPKISLQGFEVQESVEVDYGEIVTLESPIVTDADGNLYEVWTDVCDSDGGYVAIESDSFRAWDLDGYTITYVVRVNETDSEEKKTSVSVINREDFALSAEYNELEDTGKPIPILPVCEEEGVEYNYTVTKAADSSKVEVTVTDGKASFVCTDKGYYDVEITAKVGERNGRFGYTILVREGVSEAVVEHFDDQWEELARYHEDARLGNYQVVTSAECGIKDRYGDDVTMLMRDTDNEWPTFHINPRYSKEHYESLLEQGYDEVTVYCYFTSQKNMDHTYSVKIGQGGYYEKSSVKASPNTWVPITLNLQTPKNAVSRSFLYCYDWYKAQDIWYVCWHNEGSMAVRDVFAMYYTDMYVTKPVEVTVAENVKTEYTIGETLTMDDLKKIFVSEEEMRYYVNYHGERTEIKDDYVFAGNGEYTIEVLPARKDYRASAKIEVNVASEFAVQGDYLNVERKSDTVTVDISSLNASFVEKDGVTPVVTANKRVYDRHGKEYPVVDDKFVADADGLYRVEIEGAYTRSGVKCKAYDFIEMDVWSEANKYAVVGLDEYFSIAGYNYQSAIKDTLAIDEYTIGGRTQEMLKISAAGRECSVVVMKPTYSKDYYKTLLENNLDYAMYVTCDWYFDASEQTKPVEPYYDMFTDYVKQGAQEKDTWHTGKLPLSSFISLYDDIVALYDRTLEEYAAGVKYGRFVDSSGVKDPDGNVVKGYLMGTKLQTNRVDNAYLTALTVEMTDSAEAFTYSYTINENVFRSQRKGATIDLTQGKALFNGYELNGTQYTLTSKNEKIATVENNVLTIKDYGLLELVFTVTLPSGKTYDSITYRYQITVDNEAVDGFENDNLGDLLTPNT